MSRLKRCSITALLAVLLVAVLLTSCVSFGESTIDDIPPIEESETVDVSDSVNTIETPDGHAEAPTVATIVNSSPSVAVISGSCEKGAVITATSAVDEVSVKSLNGYYILEYDLGDKESRILNLTAEVEGKKESLPREITIKRDAMAETRKDQYEVVLGKEGYLFFRETIDNYTGKNVATLSAVENFLKKSVNAQITALKNKAGGQEVEVIYVLLPNAGEYYSDYLPEGTEKETFKTLYQQISEALSASTATFIDMKPVFEAHKDDGYLLYNKTDSHVTDYGGYLVYSEIMNYIAEKFPDAAARPLDEFTVSEETVIGGGDLAAYGRFDNQTVVEHRVSLTPKFSMDLGDSAHRLKLTTTNLENLQKYNDAEKSCQLINGTAVDGKVSILNRLYFCTERSSLPSAMIYRDDGSAGFVDLLVERFNNCMLGASGDYVVNLIDAGRHASAGKSVVDYVIIIVDENNLYDLVD